MPTLRLSPTSILLIAFSALTSQSAGAVGVINGDFSNGFTGWLGEVTDTSINTTSDITPLPGAYTGNFAIDSGAAVLTTSTAIDDLFSVVLYQEFTVDPAAPGETLLLSVDLVPDIDAGDFWFAQLAYGPTFSDIIDLTAQVATDITSLAGQQVEILFGVEDFDFDPDTLRIDNVLISRQAPIPGTPVLLLSALPLLLGSLARRRTRTRN